MPKAQGKKAVAAAGSKGAAKKVAAKVKSAAQAVRKKVAPKKPAAPAKPAAKKPAPKPAARPAPKPAPKAAKAPAKAVKKAVKAAAKVVRKAAARVAPKAAAPKKPAISEPKAVKPAPVSSAPVAPNVPAVPKPPAPPPEPEKAKRGRRARPRVISNGAPAASWLTSEKPRPASFIAAPARAEAPSAVAAPPASSDRLIREEDLAHPAVRTVPVRIDVEQGAGRFYVIANPMDVTVRVGEGIEWDFRYIGGADVNVEEIVIELEKPSPFSQSVFRTRKPGGARPHRQLSGGALPAAAGKRVQYTVRAMNQFRTELASTRVYLNVTA